MEHEKRKKGKVFSLFGVFDKRKSYENKEKLYLPAVYVTKLGVITILSGR